MNKKNARRLRRRCGYIEGYYGRLFNWSERSALVEHLQQLGFGTYFYAPKEDALHRLRWREPYASDWRQSFSAFCRFAGERNVSVVAGIAPGLDFDFAHLSEYRPGTAGAAAADMSTLIDKSRQLLADGAVQLALLMDDIDEDFACRQGAFDDEGQAHAELANQLSRELSVPLWVVPRVYANEIAVAAPDYLPRFTRTLDLAHTIVYCGSHIVAPVLTENDCFDVARSEHAVVFWDNLYANDYCPRKLYAGPWAGRDTVEHVLLNPTGMLETDKLLLSIMAASSSAAGSLDGWQKALADAGVPDVFNHVARFFYRPPLRGEVPQFTEFCDDGQRDALEQLLWRWKTPLAREWYPFLLSLKHDLMLASNRLSEDRIQQTQSLPLAARLLRR